MFITRLISGIILLIIAIVIFALGNIYLLPVLWIISMIAYRELTKALGCAQTTEDKGRPVFNTLEIIGLAGVTAYYAAIWFGRNATLGANPLYLLMVITAVFLAEMFAYVITFPKYNATQVMAAFFSFMYAPVMLAFVYLTRETTNGIYMVWLILISSWGCDTCAYAVGKLIGKKKIFPVLSPHKSLEGCIGGVLGAAIIGALYAGFFVEAAYPDRSITLIIAIICAIGAVMSMVGDLAASAIKRNHNIKDYGKLIPGHGGIMDRFDSMIITAPMTYFLTVILLSV
jgi:phosphatidate cytidylyltransferase